MELGPPSTSLCLGWGGPTFRKVLLPILLLEGGCREWWVLQCVCVGGGDGCPLGDSGWNPLGYGGRVVLGVAWGWEKGQTRPITGKA